MSSSNRGASSYLRRNEAVTRWNDSETAKQPNIRHSSQIAIKFEFGAMLLGAVASGDSDDVLRLIREGADVNHANIDGLTSLHQACIDENFAMVKLLVDNGASVYACDNEGWTSLHAAASGHSLEIVRYLISKGADVGAVNFDGELPVDLSSDDDIINFLDNELDKQGIDPDELREAEEKAMLEDINKWTKNGKIENVRDAQGATPLHVAASKGYLDVAKKLISMGADPNERDDDGWSPLHAAAYWKDGELCELLVSNGAHANALNNNGATPSELGDDEIKALLRQLSLKHRTPKTLPKANELPKRLNYAQLPDQNSKKPVIGILKTTKAQVGEKTKARIQRPPISKPSVSGIARPTQPATVQKVEDGAKPGIARPTPIQRPKLESPQNITPARPPKTFDVSVASERPRETRPGDQTVSPAVSSPFSSTDQRLTDALDKIAKLEQEVASLKTERNNLLKIIENLKKPTQLPEGSTKKQSESPKKFESPTRPSSSSVARPPSRR